MAFLILQNSTTADATDVNANFYHVAQGTRLPMGGDTLTSTDAAYDLGSSVATWNNLHCNNININGSITTADKSLWTLIAQTTLTATISSVEFTGLNGDNDLEYRIIASIGVSNATAELIINGTTGNDYGYQCLQVHSTSVYAERTTSSTRIKLGHLNFGGGTGVYKYLIDCFLNAKTGMERMLISSSVAYDSGTTIANITKVDGVFNDTASTITSLEIQLHTFPFNYFDIGSHIELWKRG